MRSVIPCCFSRSTMWCIIGLFISGTIGFGVLQVSGRNRVPNPPAMMTAFMLRLFAFPGIRVLTRRVPYSRREKESG